MNRQIYTIGETVFDIIFKDNVPNHGNPGGSVLNSAVTLGRLGLKPIFLSDFCNDLIGQVIKTFLKENSVTSKPIIINNDKQTSIALAFLDQNNNAQYEFYKQKPSQKDFQELDIEFQSNDVLLFGSFYAIMPEIRFCMSEVLKKAKDKETIIVYDPNFRKPHLKDLPKVKSFIEENIRFSDIVKGSDEDFSLIFNTLNDVETFKELEKINPKAHFFLTKADKGCSYYYKGVIKNFDVPKITPVSTIGAGDNFNAGIVYSIIKQQITKTYLNNQLSEKQITEIVMDSVKFSQSVCQSTFNYISKEFAKNYAI